MELKTRIAAVIAVSVCGMCLFSGCSSEELEGKIEEPTEKTAEYATAAGNPIWSSVNGKKIGDEDGYDAAITEDGESAVQFEHFPDSYKPQKSEYNFYFTYKMVHPWWDAVSLGMESAVEKYKDLGVNISFDYVAPNQVSSLDQRKKLLKAAQEDYDVIGVDVDDKKVITPVINELMESGKKGMTFASSDSNKEDGCKRIAYVGNTHNYRDGADLTEALCEKLGRKGKIVLLIGTQSSPCYEDRARAAREIINKYPDMEIVDSAYDEDNEDIAYEYTMGFIKKYPDISGIICCDMSGPVGAAKAVIEEGLQKKITIVGMDHDKQALEFLRDGNIYCLGVQDCFSMGFDTIQTAIKIADGLMPGGEYRETTDEKTTIIYKDDAKYMLRVLYGEID